MSVRYNVQFEIQDLERFQEFASQAMDATLGKPGTKTYEWFVSEDGKSCLLQQEYADDGAILSHLAAVGPEILPRLLTASTIQSIQFLGPVSDKVRAAYAQLGPTFMAPLRPHAMH